LSTIVSEPVLALAVVGVKVTLIVQLVPPAATDAPQVFVWAKFPLVEISVRVRSAFPKLVKVTF